MVKCPEWIYFQDEYYGLDAQVSAELLFNYFPSGLHPSTQCVLFHYFPRERFAPRRAQDFLSFVMQNLVSLLPSSPEGLP